MKKALLVILLLAAAAAAAWYFTARSGSPEVPFAKATRGTVSNELSTNGKVEPAEYMDVHAEVSGLVREVPVHDGDAVRKDETLAQLSEPGLEQELQAAMAREAQARADLQTLQAGGRSSDTAELDGSLNRLKADRETAQRNLDALQRLLAKQAATGYEVQQAQESLHSLDVQMQSLRERRAALVGKGDLGSAQARVREAEANVQLARGHIEQDAIHAPMSGTIYALPARAGAYLNAGDLVASIGRMNPVRVRVYVDEPELGRVAPGQKVRITWDALPGREWTGTVERRPTAVIALGTRQVGEVLCTISNPKRELVPGTNVNAFILTQVVNGALTIPKSSVRRDGGIGVFVLQKDGTVKWQPVTTGASDALRVEVLGGLQDGDAVAVATDQMLKTGQKVSPVFP